jgi:plastocyanin
MRSLRVATAVAALIVVLAACGGGSGGGGSSSPPASSGKKIDVTLKDFSITLAGGSTVQAGTYTFVVTNKGPSSHNLTVNGPGVSNQATPTFGPGTKNLTVTLKSGSYDLFCSVPGHKALGMDTKLTVG